MLCLVVRHAETSSRVSHENNAEQERLHGIHTNVPAEARIIGYTRVDAKEDNKGCQWKTCIMRQPSAREQAL